MRKNLLIGIWLLSSLIHSQGISTVKLLPPNQTGGLPLMQALAMRSSVTEWSDKELPLQTLSDLLWAANGINRAEIGKRTAPSAQNAQDVDIYVFTSQGVFLYDAKEHSLKPIVEGDHRMLFFPSTSPGGSPPPQSPTNTLSEKEIPPINLPGIISPKPMPPVILLLVSDISRFRSGTKEQRLEWAAIDTGTVSQNISLFCTSAGLGTRPRSTMDREKLKNLLQLKDTQYPLLNHPVGYKK